MGDIKLLKGQRDDALVWCTEDIMTLRTQYRIVGKLIGSHPKMPRQNHLLSRPMLLNPYEISLLLEKGFARLCEQVDVLSDSGLDERRYSFMEQHTKSLSEQRLLAYNQKKSDIQSRSEEIVAGVMKKRGGSEPYAPDEKAEVINAVIVKIQPIQEQHMLVQQPIETPWDCEVTDTKWKFPHTETERVKYLVFKDLWQQQLMLTCGAKFGGDFLVYPGDPELYHAKYIAICHQSGDQLQPTDVVQMARLASNVKKTALLCKVEVQCVTHMEKIDTRVQDHSQLDTFSHVPACSSTFMDILGEMKP